jgi:Rad3-related DNA helicase
MAEGIDLKGDLCRVNIIPKLNWPDLNDEVVKKRRSLADGQEWYAMQTLKTLMQQVGRSTRSQEDYSATYILDPMFSRMVNQYKHKLPKSFTESIVWQREAKGVA